MNYKGLANRRVGFYLRAAWFGAGSSVGANASLGAGSSLGTGSSLGAGSSPDLIFMDIELSDGLSLDLVRGAGIGCPVIFVTAYDDYWQEAFEYNGIDYLLKPVKRERLEVALGKFDELREFFQRRYKDLLDFKEGKFKNKFRNKFLVRRGTEFVSILVEEIAFFYASHKLVCLVRKDGAKFLLDQSLAEIEKQVDGSVWFWVNRKYLVNSTAVRKVSALAKSKLILEVVPGVKEDVVVSSENSAAFKKWFGK